MSSDGEWRLRPNIAKSKDREITRKEWDRYQRGKGRTYARTQLILAHMWDPTAEIHLYKMESAEKIRGQKFRPGEGIGSPEAQLTVLEIIMECLAKAYDSQKLSSEAYVEIIESGGTIAGKELSNIKLPTMTEDLKKASTSTEVMTALYKLGKTIKLKHPHLHAEILDKFESPDVYYR